MTDMLSQLNTPFMILDLSALDWHKLVFEENE